MKTLILVALLAQNDGLQHNADLENIGIACTALAVFSEARSEPDLGQAAVAEVIRRRQSALPLGADPCDIVEEPDQFHGVRDWPYPRKPWETNAAAWMKALEISSQVFLGEYALGPCKGATHFMTKRPQLPAWARTMKPACEVGNHLFLIDTTMPELSP